MLTEIYFAWLNYNLISKQDTIRILKRNFKKRTITFSYLNDFQINSQEFKKFTKVKFFKCNFPDLLPYSQALGQTLLIRSTRNSEIHFKFKPKIKYNKISKTIKFQILD
jgi:hypothetical protein